MFVSGGQCIRKWATYLPEGVGEVDAREVDVNGCVLRWRTLRRHVKLPAEYDLVDSVADAHTLIQTIWPLETAIERLAGTVNVELFVEKHFDWEAIMPTLAAFHRKHGGRTELRDRSLGGKTVTAFDVIMSSGKGCSACLGSGDLGAWFGFLSSELGVESGSLHAGKFLAAAPGPVTLLEPAEFWPAACAGSAKEGSSTKCLP